MHLKNDRNVKAIMEMVIRSTLEILFESGQMFIPKKTNYADHDFYRGLVRR